MAQSLQETVKVYCNRFQVFPTYFEDLPPPQALDLIIVIPSFKEPDVLPTLRSLAKCQGTSGKIEIIIVINAPEESSPDILETNEGSYQQIANWSLYEKPDHFHVLTIREESLSRKHAGAGWARKIGMDEALRHWALLEVDGPILCLDADCTVSGDYLEAAKQVFQHPGNHLAHFHFEHQIGYVEDDLLKKGIIQYELHLRCYIQGLKWAGYPFAVHTVGSCMAVRASIYAKSGGMNKRKAGEDFYFMHKILPLGGFATIPATVYPSSRKSDRVPFGTGKAQLDFMNGLPERQTYDLPVYQELKLFFDLVPIWYDKRFTRENLTPSVRLFLDNNDFENQLDQLVKQSKTKAAYFRRFWQWMDGFRVLKFTHFLRDEAFPNKPVIGVAEAMMINFFQEQPVKEGSLLDHFRTLDRR